MIEAHEADFAAFVSARYKQLLGVGRALTGDWQLAEDLTQTALEKVYAQWRKNDVAIASPYAYTRSVMAHEFVTWRRRHRWRREKLVQDVELAKYETAAEPVLLENTEDLLKGLPSHERCVLVLRFYEDMSVEEVAKVLGIPEVTVKSRTARGLTRIRDAQSETV